MGNSLSRKPFPGTQLLDTPVSNIYKHIHSPLVLGVFISQFRALVDAPVQTLLAGLPPVLVLQAIYCAICLPPVTHGNVSKNGKKKKPKKPKTATTKDGEKTAEVAPSETNLVGILYVRVFFTFRVSMIGSSANDSQQLLLTTLLTLIAIPAIFLLTILLGAPVTTHLLHTTLLAAHISLLSLFPLLYSRPLRRGYWLDILSGTAPLDEVFGGFIGAMIGAWVGAVPIPLDWDRAWQAWPITVTAGAYGGWVVGRGVGAVVNGRWRGSWN
jgi:phosphatidylinositol glycan class F